MKRLIHCAVSVALFTIGLGSTAFATTDLELISGGDTLYISTTSGGLLCNGTSAGCAAFGATGSAVTGGFDISAADFNGWSITISDVGSNSPNCPNAGAGGPGCLNSENITANSTGAGTLGAFDFSSGFVTSSGFIVANTSAIQTGALQTQQAYATTSGADPLGAATTTFAGAVAGQAACGAALSSAPPGVMAIPTNCVNPGNPVSLELATIFTTNSGGGGFTVGGNISSAVPEPATVALFGTVLVFCASGLRRRRKLSQEVRS